MKKRCKNCQRQAEEIERLKEELALVKFELEEVRRKRYKPKREKGEEEEKKGSGKKIGGIFGHKGWFRKKPEKVDKIEEVKIERCPDCGSKGIREYKGEIEEHIQEDIILPQVEATLYRKHIYYCKRCQRAVMGKGRNEIANSYIWPMAKAWVVFLKYSLNRFNPVESLQAILLPKRKNPISEILSPP